MKNVLLLLDFNNILIKGTAKMPYLSHEGKCTSGIYGMLNQMVKYINLYSPDFVFICNDYPPYHRKELFSGYKQKKGEMPKSMLDLFSRVHESREYCRDVFNRMNIPVLEEKGFEADDMIALAIKKYHKEFKKIVIVSNDSDLYQLLVYQNVLMDKGPKGGIYSHRELKKDFGILPEQWIDVLSIAGSHNAVPSIKKGVKEKTAIKIMKDEKMYSELLQEYKEEIKLRKRLARLPFENLSIPILEISEHKKRKGLMRNFTLYLKRKYGIVQGNENYEKAFKRFLA